MSTEPTRRNAERVEVQRLHAEHDNISQLLLVLESHLALMNDGEPFDAAVMLDALDYLLDYVHDFHRDREANIVAAVASPESGVRSCLATLSARHDAIETSGAELYHRLALAVRDVTMNRTEVVRLGFSYCAELRRVIGIEERALSDASGERAAAICAPPEAGDQSEYRSRFEELTQRIGCGCAYEER